MSDDRTDPPHAPSHPLESLSTTPVPLVGPDQVRARGRQRARRSQALLAGAGVVLVAALGGSAALLVGGPADQALVGPAGTPSVGPSVAAGPTVTPSPDPCAATSVPRGLTCRVGPDGNRVLEPPPDLQPTLFESPSPGSVRDLPADTLVTVASLEAAFPSLGAASWTRNASSRTSQPWDLEPCGASVGRPSGSFLSGDYRLESTGTSVPEGPGVRDQVSRLASPADATAAVEAFRSAVASCPVATYTTTYGGQTPPMQVSYKHEVVSQDPYVFARLIGVGGNNFYPFPVYYGVVAVDDLVAVWSYAIGEGTDPSGALEVAALVRDGLCRTAGTC